MALPSSGPMRLGADVNVELGLSATTQISLGSVAVRGLYGVPSGAIRLAADGYGKSSVFKTTISTSQLNLNLRTYVVNAGWDQASAVEVTVDSNIYIWSDSVSTPALTINGSWPKGITVINNGFIMGRGGFGGSAFAGAAQAGGPAVSLGVNVSFTNNSFIGGGGGGGGAGRSNAGGAGGGGGGAGGGTGGNYRSGSIAGGGAGGAIGQVGGNGGSGGNNNFGGGGGGRIMPGTGGGANTGGGAGGGGGNGFGTASGGPGGSAGNNGSNWQGSGQNPQAGGGGGGWGASGGSGSGSGGQGGGKAINLNGFTATFLTSGTVYGGVS
jgi:hypothetical protein